MMRPRGRASAAVRTLAVALAVLAGCAPRPQAPVAVTADVRRERFLAALARRESAAMVEADATIFPRAASGGALPALDADVIEAPPASFRVRVSALFGTALDLAGEGDSLIGYVPSRREGAEVDARRDSLAIPQPGRFGARLIAALWAPPEAAWASAVQADSLVAVAWREGSDSLRLTVASNGLPAALSMWRPGEQGLDVRYTAWTRADMRDWPARIELADREQRYSAVVRLERVRVRAAADPARLRVPIPPGSRRLTWAELSHAWRRITEASR